MTVATKDRDEFYRLDDHGPTLAEQIAYSAGYEIPDIDATVPNLIEFYYKSCNVTITIEGCDAKGHAEIKVWSGDSELSHALAWQEIRLLSQTPLQGLVKELEKHKTKALADLAWADMLKYCAWKAVQMARDGTGVEEIWPEANQAQAPNYLVYPILPVDHPAVIFGEFSSFKSTTALLIAYVAQLPYTENGLGLKPQSTPARCLYLDAEDARDSFSRRWGAIQMGLGGKTEMSLLYRRITQPLYDMVPTIQRTIADEGVRLLIIDSLGLAARGNLNEPESAIKYHDALRQIGITSLTLAHTSKDPLLKRRTIFGSVFFTNLARSVWETEAKQEPGASEGTLCLANRKSNLSKLHLPLGYELKFTDTATHFKAIDVRETPHARELSLSWQIKDLLKGGLMNAKDIAKELDKDIATVRVELSRMKGRGELVNVDQKWGLAT